MTKEDYYELLDVPPDATADRIREAVAAQRRYWTALMNHRDLERRQEAERILEKLKQAYETLTDPARRTSYDEALRRAKRPARRQPAGPAPSPANRASDWPCPECNTVNPRGNKVCVQCGAALTKECPECSGAMYIADKFCGECGSHYEEVIAHYESEAVLAATEAEQAAQTAQQARAKLDLEQAMQAVNLAETAAGRAQDAAKRAGTQRAAQAAHTAREIQREARACVEAVEEVIRLAKERRRQWWLALATICIAAGSAVFGVLEPVALILLAIGIGVVRVVVEHNRVTAESRAEEGVDWRAVQHGMRSMVTFLVAYIAAALVARHYNSLHRYIDQHTSGGIPYLTEAGNHYWGSILIASGVLLAWPSRGMRILGIVLLAGVLSLVVFILLLALVFTIIAVAG